MGTIFNPDNDAFVQTQNSKIYVDKTGLIEFLNQRLSTESKCIALSHARRFGKSHAAKMIDAYYSRGCDSSKLFDGTKIAKSQNYRKHLNKYDVIHIDIASMWDFCKENLIEELNKRISDELKEEYSSKYELNYNNHIQYLLSNIYNKTKIQFVIIIDEWDCVIRNSDNQKLVHEYLQFLHALFKSNESCAFLALGYITGILPIKKIQDESALNNFDEYTMLSCDPITEYFGFTDNEVQELCTKYGMDFDSMKRWYDGYLIDNVHMSNPNSVVKAIEKGKFASYWKNTSSFETINNFITLNYDGLKDDVMSMLAGNKVIVHTESFSNDLNSISSKDEALTALLHLGYLASEKDDDENFINEEDVNAYAYIPNYEVKKSYQAALQKGAWGNIAKSISACNELLKATIDKDSDKVAELLELAHEAYSSALKYNDENSLACVLTMAYFTAPAYYNVIREFPAGKGFADFAFIPRANTGYRPAMIVELKYDKSAETAIKQIKDKRYAGNLKGFAGKILLVGINYNKNANDKKHTCVIEEYQE